MWDFIEKFEVYFTLLALIFGVYIDKRVADIDRFMGSRSTSLFEVMRAAYRVVFEDRLLRDAKLHRFLIRSAQISLVTVTTIMLIQGLAYEAHPRDFLKKVFNYPILLISAVGVNILIDSVSFWKTSVFLSMFCELMKLIKRMKTKITARVTLGLKLR